ncbi:MAG TPA: hypothetical protein VMI54_23725, partial [Polyangiaceae bacterium]|nr:hypothetical protein [Polyangiaceae bacterium]
TRRLWARAVPLAFALTAVLVPVVLFALTRPSDRVLMRWTAPSGEHVLVYEGERDLGAFFFGGTRRHYLYVGRDDEPSGYGYRMAFDLHPELVDAALSVDAYAKRLVVTFRDDGLEIAEPSGHRVFVPKRAYTGGR